MIDVCAEGDSIELFHGKSAFTEKAPEFVRRIHTNICGFVFKPGRRLLGIVLIAYEVDDGCASRARETRYRFNCSTEIGVKVFENSRTYRHVGRCVELHAVQDVGLPELNPSV